MPHFRNRHPAEIDAVQWTGNNIIEVMVFMRPQEPIYLNNLSHVKFIDTDDLIGITTSEGIKVARKGEWIIRGVGGELYPCPEDVFASMYEAAPDGGPR
jgi:hypothetical protein